MDSEWNDEDSYFVGIFDYDSPGYEADLVSVCRVSQELPCQHGTCRGDREGREEVIKCVRADLEFRNPNTRAEINRVFNRAIEDCINNRQSLNQKYGEEAVIAFFNLNVVD
jgi:hypothetical protein